MSLNNPVLGEGYVPAYQISPTPYVTSSNITLGAIKEYDFPFVTKSVFVQNTSNSSTTIAISFTQNGLSPANANFITLDKGETFSQDVRTSKLFVSGASGSASYQLFVGLTNIPVKNFLTVTGSNGYAGVG
jgi:hypothetical protein